MLNAVRWLSDLANTGIYVLEGLSEGQSIPVRRKSVVAFLGSSPRGPVGIPVKLNSADEFEKRFGSANASCRMQALLAQFFANGAASAIVVRVCRSSRRNQIVLPGPSGPLVLTATNPGPREYLRASVDYDGIPDSDRNRFNLVIHRLAAAGSPLIEEQEIYQGLSLNPDSPNYAGHILLGSELVYVESGLPGERPECTLAPGIEVGKSYVYADADWQDPDGISDYDLIGSAAEGTGLSALNQIPVVDFVCPVPDEQDLGPVALFAAERYCRKRFAMLVRDPPSDWHSVQDVMTSQLHSRFSSPNVFVYFPRPQGSADEGRGSALGAILGRLAADDDACDIWNAPRVRLSIRCPGRLPLRLDAASTAALARRGVNALHQTSDGLYGLQGLVTLAQGQGVTAAWGDLRKRRTALFIAESISCATRWTAFQSADDEIWTSLEKQLCDFLRGLYIDGAIAGAAAEDAYYVRHDEDANDPSSNVRFLVGFALDADEFHVFRFSHDRIDCDVREVAWRPGVALAG
jgi:hypothetical protein